MRVARCGRSAKEPLGLVAMRVAQLGERDVEQVLEAGRDSDRPNDTVTDAEARAETRSSPAGFTSGEPAALRHAHQGAQLVVVGRVAKLRAQPAQRGLRDLRPVDDRFIRHRVAANEVGAGQPGAEQRRGCRIGDQHVPVAVDDQCWIRLMCRQEAVDRGADRRKSSAPSGSCR
jgi:hypothetical protein